MKIFLKDRKKVTERKISEGLCFASVITMK